MLHSHTPYRLLSDERLARHAASGDDRAFSFLYQRHESALLAYCRSITRDPEDARDALQSAMASAYDAIPRREPGGGAVRAWLFRIAHNESVNVLRRRRDELPLLDNDVTLVPSAAEQSSQRATAHEALAEVAQLPPRQRGALVLRELHGLEYDEIAAALSVSEVNARQLVFAARSGVADSRAGRNLPCELVRDAIEAGDRRAQRRRPLRAHLRSCDDCRAYSKVSRPVGRRAALALPGGWIAGWAQALSSGGASLSTGAGELMAPAKGVAVVAVAAAVAAATASHDHERVAQATHAKAATSHAASAQKTQVASAALTPMANVAPATGARFAPTTDTRAIRQTTPIQGTMRIRSTRPVRDTTPIRRTRLVRDTTPTRIRNAQPIRDSAPRQETRQIRDAQPTGESAPTRSRRTYDGGYQGDSLDGSYPREWQDRSGWDGGSGERSAWRDGGGGGATGLPADPSSAPGDQTAP